MYYPNPWYFYLRLNRVLIFLLPLYILRDALCDLLIPISSFRVFHNSHVYKNKNNKKPGWILRNLKECEILNILRTVL